MAAVNVAFDAFMSRARAELALIPSPVEKLRRLAHLHLESLGANRDLAIVFQTELRQSERLLAPSPRQHMTEYFDLLRQAIRQGQAEGTFRPGLPDKIAAKCLFGALDEMVTSWVLDSSHYKLSEVADIAADIVLLGLQK
jgi:TetR/AcrR family fatty acid metabolism transcriptional regulator